MIRIVGDISFTDGFFDVGHGVGASIKSGKDPFAKIKRRKNDLWIGNFEGVASDLSNLKGIKREIFRIDPRCLSELHHLNYYSVANNHIMQHGPDAYKDTLNNIRSYGSEYFGDQQNKTIQFTYKHKIFSITGLSFRKEEHFTPALYWHNPDFKAIEEEYSRVRDCDFKIIYMHWGNEYMNYPYPDQERFAHWLIDVGFDLVIGVHPHVLQGYEIYKHKYIFYSLGNFVFNMANPKTYYGGIVNVDVINENIQVDPGIIHIESDYFPIEISDTEIPHIFRFQSLNTLIGRDILHEAYYKENMRQIYRNRLINRLFFIRNVFKYSPFSMFLIAKDFFQRKRV